MLGAAVANPRNLTCVEGGNQIGDLDAGSVAAAVANAVYRATGFRVRDLPIAPERLLAAVG